MPFVEHKNYRNLF